MSIIAVIVAVVLILLITGLAWLLNKALPFKVCPICVGVSGTWFLATAGILSGFLSPITYQLIIAVLMGGTVVGTAYQGEKVFDWAAENIFKFRVPVIIIGFILAFLALANLSWFTLVLEALVLAIVTYLYFVAPYGRGKSRSDSIQVKKLEEEMKNCC